MAEKYILEWKTKDQFSLDKRNELIEEILKEFDQEIEAYEIIENEDESVGWNTIGTFTVKSKESLVDLYRLINSREDESRPGSIRKKGGEEIYAINSDKKDIKDMGGKIIGEVENHLLVEIPQNKISELLDFDTLKK